MELDLSDLMKRVSTTRATLDARSGKNNVQKPPQGKSRWRVLPGWRKNDPMTYYHEFGQHWIREPDPTNPAKPMVKGVVVCEQASFGRECDCCKQIDTVKMGMRSAGLTKDSGPWKLIDEMRGKVVYIVNVLRRDGDAKSDTPVLLQLGDQAFKGYLSTLSTRGEEGVNILALTGGKDIIIERTGSSYDTEYSVTDAGVQSDVPHEVMDHLINIDAFVEAERLKGISKISMLADAARATLGLAGVKSSSVLIPPASSLVPARPAPSRVIEENEVPFAAQGVSSVVDTPVPVTRVAAQEPAVSAPAAPATSATSTAADLLNDQDLADMIANL